MGATTSKSLQNSLTARLDIAQGMNTKEILRFRALISQSKQRLKSRLM